MVGSVSYYNIRAVVLVHEHGSKLIMVVELKLNANERAALAARHLVIVQHITIGSQRRQFEIQSLGYLYHDDESKLR